MTYDFATVAFPGNILVEHTRAPKVNQNFSKEYNYDFAKQLSKKGEVLGKDVFPATEFGVGLFPSFSRLRATSKRGSKDDDEPDAFWFFQDGKIIIQASH